MNFKYFEGLKKNTDEAYDIVSASYLIDDAIFYVEPNFYTQLKFLEVQYRGEVFDKILASIVDIAKRNKKVIFTGDFDNPLIRKDDFVYREMSDILAENKISFDIKINPESDWKD